MIDAEGTFRDLSCLVTGFTGNFMDATSLDGLNTNSLTELIGAIAGVPLLEISPTACTLECAIPIALPKVAWPNRMLR